MDGVIKFMRKFSHRLFKQLTVIAIFLLTSLIIVNAVNTENNTALTANTTANTANMKSSSIVFVQNTNEVVHGVNENVRLPMASTTKIMTALIACESGRLNETVAIPKEATLVEGSSIYLKEGEKIKLIDLVYGLMLRSGNDSAVCIAKYLGGSIENFATIMNRKAIDLGAKNTNFVNPHGLHDDNHYTTAYDLGLITCKALNNVDFKNIVNTKKHTIKSEGNPDRVIANKNKMLSMYDGCIGVKTGYTKAAGRCLVSASERNGIGMVCVVLNHSDMWNDSCKLLDSGYSVAKKVTLAIKDKALISVPIAKVNTTVEGYIKDNIEHIVIDKKNNSIEYKMTFVEKISLPLKKDVVIGKLEIIDNNRLLFSQNIYNMKDIEGKGVYPLSELAQYGYGLEWLKLLD